MLLHSRNTPNKLGSSPVQRLMSRCSRTSLPATVSHYQPKIIENVPENVVKSRRLAKSYYNRKARDLQQLSVGQSVTVQLRPDTDKLWHPGSVKEQISDRSYLIEVNEALYRRDRNQIRTFEEKAKTDRSISSKGVLNIPEVIIKEGLKEKDSVPATNDNRDAELIQNAEVIPSKLSLDNIRTPQPKRDRTAPKKFKDFVM